MWPVSPDEHHCVGDPVVAARSPFGEPAVGDVLLGGCLVALPEPERDQHQHDARMPETHRPVGQPQPSPAQFPCPTVGRLLQALERRPGEDPSAGSARVMLTSQCPRPCRQRYPSPADRRQPALPRSTSATLYTGKSVHISFGIAAVDRSGAAVSGVRPGQWRCGGLGGSATRTRR